MQIGDLSKSTIGGASQLSIRTSQAETRLEDARRAAKSCDPKETAHQFERLFAVMLVKELRRSMPTGMFGDGAGADVYESWFDEHLGGALAKEDALGIAGMVKTALERAQAAQDMAAMDRVAQDVATLDTRPGS